MFKILPLYLICFFTANVAMAQYYYKDIITNKQVKNDMNNYRENKVRQISLKSTEGDGEESEGFICEKSFSKNYRKTELFTRAEIASASLVTSEFDADGKIISTNDSSKISVTDIRYTYDDKQRVSIITSTIHSMDDDYENRIYEDHIYTYDESGKPVKMMLIKNKKDTGIILFSLDEKGNVAVEKDTRTGSKYYYYYDGKNRVTDIVHASEYTTGRLKPDYIFEYNTAGLITKMTAVKEGTSNYVIWKYDYDDGLRIKERAFTDERKLMGTIDYEYKRK